MILEQPKIKSKTGRTLATGNFMDDGSIVFVFNEDRHGRAAKRLLDDGLIVDLIIGELRL